MPETVVRRIVDLHDDAVARRITDDGQVLGLLGRHAVPHGVAERLRGFAQMGVQEFIELRLRGEKSGGGCRESGSQKRQKQRKKELPANGGHAWPFVSGN